MAEEEAEGGPAAAAAAAAAASATDPTDAGARAENRSLSPRQVCLQGLRDALSWHKTLFFLARLQSSPSVSMQQCFVLNGTLFLGSIVLFNVVLSPLLLRTGELLAWVEGDAGEAREAEWSAARESVLEWSWIAFQALWLVPMYLVSIVLNAAFNVDIAKQVHTLHIGAPRKSVDSLAQLIRDSMYNYLLMGWMSLFGWAVYYVWLVGPIVSMLWTSWAIAFYAYDLAWTLKGWSLQRRLLYFQRNWLYMLGFGMPPALVTFFLPQLLGYGVYALALPVSLILAVVSEPVQHEPSRFFPKSLRVFVLAEHVNLLLMRLFVSR